MTRPTSKTAIVSLPVFARERVMRSRPLRIVICLAMCLLPALVFGQTNDNWLGGTGYWSTASQWSAGLPTSSSNAIIGSDGASAVTLNYNGAQCAGLTIDGGDSLTLVDGTIFTVFGPTISNAGVLSMNAISGGAILDINGAVTLTGSGGLTMSNNANNELMGYAQPNGATFTNQTTIQGAGNIGSPSGGSFVNQGTVNANQTTSLTMSVGPGAVTNKGTLEATNGATLALNGGTVTNTAGTIHADPASTVTLTNVTVSGGTLTTSGTGTIQANCCLSYSTLNGVTLNGTYQLNNNNIGYLQGTITNNGSMQINSTGSSGTFLDIVGAVTLKGTGTLTMSNNVNNALMGYAQANGATLTNQITIEGAGSISPASSDTFINQATVNANQTNPLLITASGTVTNTGTLEATSGATLELENGTITNTGGVIHADSASIVSLYGMTISGGTLTTSGSGIIEAVCCQGYSTLDGVTIDGAFQWVSNNIGYLQGTITNNGPMTFNAPSGTSVVLDVDGAVTLNGKGTLTSTNANNEIMGYAQNGGGSLLNQSTIEGTVQFGIGAGNSVTNEGTIYANQKTSLFIDANQGTFTNTGTLKVKAGSVLYIQGGGFTNFSGTTFTGGKYLVNGTLEFDGADVVTNAANITLTGAKSAIINQSGTNGLASFATNTKTGSFSLMSGALLNSTVTSGNFSNAGKVTVGAKSNFQISAPQPNTATYTQTAGTTTVDGTLSATGGVTIQAGKLYGKGTIATSVVSSGSVTAGDSATKPGVLSPSTYAQNASGSLNIAVGGLDVGTQYGQLAVANGASLNGTLNIKLVNSFVPAVGNTFVIVTGSAISGTFAIVNGLSINGSEHFTITYNPTNVTLTVVSGS
jgi:hypothetical protein